MKSVIVTIMMITAVMALNKIVIKGNKFFDSVTGDQFFVKGIAYAPAYDPLLDIPGLKTDIALMKAINVNLVRIYQNDWTQNHDEAMQLLDEAGMYVMFDLGDPKLSIEYNGPWSTMVFENYRRKIDRFAGYSNTFAYLAGNEVVFNPGESINAAYVKAAVRDSKAYIKSKGYNIPVGYAGADVPAQPLVMDYLNCDTAAESVDFYGLNSYSWCGDSNMVASNFNSFYKYANYSVPFLFTEIGCNSVEPRPWTELKSIFGPDLEEITSGTIVFEFSQGYNKYGLVDINASTGVRTPLPDYYTYQSAVSKVNPKIIKMSDYNPPSYPLQNCPPVTEPENYAGTTNWLSASSPLPPTPNNPQCHCMYSQLKCRTNKSYLDFTVETRAYRDKINDVKKSICPGSNCYPIGGAPQYASYGKWSMCNPYEQLSFAMNALYAQNGACTYTDVPGGLVDDNSYAGVDCTTLANDYNSFSLAYPANDPVSGEPITAPTAVTCTSGQSKCGNKCYDPSAYCCTGAVLTTGQCSTGGVTSSSQTDSPAATSSSSTPTDTQNSGVPSTTSAQNGQSTTSQNGQSTNNQNVATTSAVDRQQGSAATTAMAAGLLFACIAAAL